MIKGNKRNAAFTLSEVLITMTIIGVIAAITIPVIHANYTRQAASSKIKKFYSMMNQAAIRSKAAGKDWTDWADTANTTGDSSAGINNTSADFIENYILPYLIYHKTKKSGIYYYVYLNDGTSFYAGKGNCLDFVYDTNGDRKPNKEGRDRFRFLYCPYSDNYWAGSGYLIPYLRASTQTREEALSLCKSNGMYCSALLSFDSWEFKKDYPQNI